MNLYYLALMLPSKINKDKTMEKASTDTLYIKDVSHSFGDKKVLKNQKLRVKFPDAPEKYLTKIIFLLLLVHHLV